MKKLISGCLAYVLVTFIVQALSHFVVFKSHFDSISFARQEPMFLPGVLTMILQGLVLTHLFVHYNKDRSRATGLRFGLLAGAFLVSYQAFVEPAKYAAPSYSEWMLVELCAGFVQFSLFGLILGRIFPPSNQ